MRRFRSESTGQCYEANVKGSSFAEVRIAEAADAAGSQRSSTRVWRSGSPPSRRISRRRRTRRAGLRTIWSSSWTPARGSSAGRRQGPTRTGTSTTTACARRRSTSPVNRGATGAGRALLDRARRSGSDGRGPQAGRQGLHFERAEPGAAERPRLARGRHPPTPRDARRRVEGRARGREAARVVPGRPLVRGYSGVVGREDAPRDRRRRQAQPRSRRSARSCSRPRRPSPRPSRSRRRHGQGRRDRQRGESDQGQLRRRSGPLHGRWTRRRR